MESVPKVARKVVEFSRPTRQSWIREILDSEDTMRQLNEADDFEIFDPIVLTDGKMTYCYALEDEIVVYKADESLNYYCCAREVDGLNTFIKEIAVSNFFFGKYHSQNYY